MSGNSHSPHNTQCLIAENAQFFQQCTFPKSHVVPDDDAAGQELQDGDGQVRVRDQPVETFLHLSLTESTVYRLSEPLETITICLTDFGQTFLDCSYYIITI